MARQPKRISLPKEHGAYLTLLLAVLAALCVAPAPLASLGAGLAFFAGFLARGPFDRKGEKFSFRALDPAAIALFILMYLFGLGLLWPRGLAVVLIALCTPPLFVLCSAYLHRRRLWRALGFELAAMGLFGASAGFFAWAGGLKALSSLGLGLSLGVHSLLSVLLVRAELRRKQESPWLLASGGLLFVGGASFVLLGLSQMLPALLPRAGQLAMRLFWASAPVKPLWVGLRELALLSAAAALSLLSL